MELTQDSYFRQYYVADEHRRRLHTARAYRLRRMLRRERGLAE